jgi:hypothetical protein
MESFVRTLLSRLVPTLALAGALAAQSANTLLLPDLFDFRPSAERATARLAELSAEATLQASLGNPATAAQIQAVVANLQSIRSGTQPVPPASSFDFHVVSFYEGFGATSSTGGTATVEVDRAGGAVVLVLNAYEPIQWTITATASTTLLAVVAYSYEPQVLNVPPGTLTAQLSLIGDNDGDYWGIPGAVAENEARLNATVWSIERLGAFPATVTGDYTAPGTPFVVGAGNQDWLDQWVTGEAVREGQTWNVATRANLVASVQGDLFLPLLTPPNNPLSPTPGGLPQVALASPLGIVQPLVPLPGGVTNYALGPNLLPFGLNSAGPGFLDFASFGVTPIPPDPTLTPFSFVNAITFDSLRNRLLVSSFGGGGVLYAWDLASNQWSELANPNNDAPSAIAYHPVYDLTFGLRVDPYAPVPYSLNRYDATGTMIGSVPLALPVIDYYGEPQQLYAVGSRLAYTGPGRTIFGIAVRHCYVIEPLTGDVVYAGILIG